MDDGTNTVRVQVAAGRGRTPSVIVVVIVAFFIVSVVKPWALGDDGAVRSTLGSGGAGTSGSSSGAAAAQASPSPSTPPAVDANDPNAMACLSDETNQLVAFERWQGNQVRNWVAIADHQVSSPLDPDIVRITMFSTHVIGIGVCGPRAQSAASDTVDLGTTLGPGASLVDIQSYVQTPAGLTTVDLGAPPPLVPRAQGSDAALLFAPLHGIVADPAASASASVSNASTPVHTSSTGPFVPVLDPPVWSPSGYAIGYRFATDGSNVVRWLRLDLRQGAGHEYTGSSRP